MKKLITIFAFIPSIAFAQAVEIGLSGGISMNSKPTNNMYTKGDQSPVNYDGKLTVLADLPMDWQIGGEINSCQLSRQSTTPFFRDGDNNGKIIYSHLATTFSAIVNRKFFASNGGYLYLGGAAGANILRNCRHMESTNDQYRGPDGGYGAVFGLQGGWTLNLSDRWSLNTEIAARYLDVNYQDNVKSTDGSTIHFRIMEYPLTVGVRYNIY